MHTYTHIHTYLTLFNIKHVNAVKVVTREAGSVVVHLQFVIQL